MSQSLGRNYLFDKPSNLNSNHIISLNNMGKPFDLFSKLYPIIEPPIQTKNKRPPKEEKYFYTNKIPVEINNNELGIDLIPTIKESFEFIDRKKYIESINRNNFPEELIMNQEDLNIENILLPKIELLPLELILKIDSGKLDQKLLLAMKQADLETESMLSDAKYRIEKMLEFEKKIKEKYELNDKQIKEKYIELLKSINDPEQLKKRNMINQFEKEEFTKKFNLMEKQQSLIIHNKEIQKSEASNIFKQNQQLKNKLVLLKRTNI